MTDNEHLRRRCGKMNKKTLIAVMTCLLVLGIVNIEGRLKTKAFNLKTDTLEELDSLSVEQLVVKVLPVRGHAIYVTFPDGGNMLIDTGGKNDSGKLVRLVKKGITSAEGKFGLMSLFGWKPRIDWVILTGSGANRTGGLEKVLKKFNVRRVISYADMNPKKMVKDKNLEIRLKRLADVILTLNIDHIKLSTGEKVDLEQVVSPVELIALDSKKSLSLRLIYSRFSFVFLSDIDRNTQLKMVNKYGNSIKSTVVYTGKPLAETLKGKIAPKFSIQTKDDVTFITDGEFMSTVPYDYLVK
jgi:hypothetical protein